MSSNFSPIVGMKGAEMIDLALTRKAGKAIRVLKPAPKRASPVERVQWVHNVDFDIMLGFKSLETLGSR